MKTYKYHSILAFLAFCICTACTKDIGMEGLPQGKDYLKVYAIIGETATAEARNGETGGEETGGEGTTTPGNKDRYGTPMDELFSYKATNKGGGFVKGCQIGLYSVKNVNGVNNKERLVNEPLTFIEKENNIGDTRIAGFKSDEIEIASMTNLGPTFVYYPYSADNDIALEDRPTEIINWEYPINIYKTPSSEGDQNQIIDLLTATSGGTLNSTYGVILYTFKHACSMLMIHRGEGFDKKETKVEVKIKNKRQAYISRTTGSFSLKFRDVTNESTAEIPTVFPTNFCEDYEINATTGEQDVYSVILPPGAIVEYIKMEDNFGTWQYIRPNDGDITLKEGWRQPVTVKMTGLYPTIYPHAISPWENEKITIDKNSAPGIYDSEDFMKWVKAYNKNNTETLKMYGTNDADNNTGTWTFHLYTDIDFSGESGTSSTTEYQYFIQTFTDKLEGHGHTLKNITLKKTDDNNNNNVGFISTLDGGSINNLKINGITVIATEYVDANPYVGTLAGSITDGSITNCKITGINLECKQGYAGALAGKASVGTFDTCLLEGELQLGKEATNDNNSYKLFGTKDESLTIESTKINTSGVYIFKEIETSTGSGDDETGQEGEITTGGNTENNVEGGN